MKKGSGVILFLTIFFVFTFVSMAHAYVPVSGAGMMFQILYSIFAGIVVFFLVPLRKIITVLATFFNRNKRNK